MGEIIEGEAREGDVIRISEQRSTSSSANPGIQTGK